MFTEKAVLPAVAPQHVADEGMADVGEVAPDLVGAAGQGADPDQAEAGRGVAANGDVDFRRAQAGEFGLGRLLFPGLGPEGASMTPFCGAKPRITAT